MPRRMSFWVGVANQRTTWCIQQAKLGVKQTCKRGWRASQFWCAVALGLPSLIIARWMSNAPVLLASVLTVLYTATGNCHPLPSTKHLNGHDEHPRLADPDSRLDLEPRRASPRCGKEEAPTVRGFQF